MGEVVQYVPILALTSNHYTMNALHGKIGNWDKSKSNFPDEFILGNILALTTKVPLLWGKSKAPGPRQSHGQGVP